MKTLRIYTPAFIVAAFLIASGFTVPGTAKSETTLIKEHPDKKYIKVALLLDTSNSMDGLINQAKAYLWDVVNELSYARCENKAPDLLIALYEYGNDGLPSREGYIRQVTGFTDDLDEISEKLFSLTTNGGSEFCGQVIQTSLRQLDWGRNADDLKLVFIAGNEPFTQGGVNYKDAAKDAVEKGVVVNTIHCGSYHAGVQGMWADGARRTGGEYMIIDHNEAIVQIKTPYDDLILQLNIQLNKTYIAYGAQGRYKAAMQAEQDVNAASVNEEIAVKRAVSKSSGMYKNKQWDMVDAAKDRSFDYEDLKAEELPKELKGKSSAEIKAYVAKK
ncbi:MAG: VWA domain-containing protein, partial [Sinomicrobium sp.]|nr:VWA domain-containing protein [Sinomicrobium sp.]